MDLETLLIILEVAVLDWLSKQCNKNKNFALKRSFYFKYIYLSICLKIELIIGWKKRNKPKSIEMFNKLNGNDISHNILKVPNWKLPKYKGYKINWSAKTITTDAPTTVTIIADANNVKFLGELFMRFLLTISFSTPDKSMLSSSNLLNFPINLIDKFQNVMIEIITKALAIPPIKVPEINIVNTPWRTAAKNTNQKSTK